MMEKYYCCSGEQGCGKLFVGSHPDVCPECGNTEFSQGIQNLGFRAKQELAVRKRAENNKKVTRNYGLKR